MVFSSTVFLWYFLPLVLGCTGCCPRAAERAPRRRQPPLLRLGRGRDPGCSSVAWPSTCRRLLLGLEARADRRAVVLVVAVALDLALLAIWKYAGFFTERSRAQRRARLRAGRRCWPSPSRSASRSSRSTISLRRRRLPAGRAPRSGTSSTSPATWRCSRSSSPGRSSATTRSPTSSATSRQRRLRRLRRRGPALRLGPGQEGHHRRHRRAGRRRRLRRQRRAADHGDRLARRARPTRSRSTSTSPATRDMAIGLARMFGFRSRRTSTALLGAFDHRLLAALAHDAVALVPRLPLHPARRQPRTARPQTYRNLLHRLLPDRPLARRGLDVRASGALYHGAPARDRAGHGPRARPDERARASPSTGRSPSCSSMVGWVFFRRRRSAGRRLLEGDVLARRRGSATSSRRR